MKLECSGCRFFTYTQSYQGKFLHEGDGCPLCGRGLQRGSGWTLPERLPNELVSVVIPFFKGEKWVNSLRCTLDAQYYRNIEVLLVGDGCLPPDIGGVFCSIRAERGGIAATTNVGVATANGEFILFMDQDDELDPECILLMAGFLHNNPEYGAVYARQILISRGEETEAFTEGFNRLSLLDNNTIGHPIMVRSNVARKCAFDPREDLAQDIGYYLRLSEVCQIGFVDAALYKWNLHGGNPSLRQRDEQEARMKESIRSTANRRYLTPSICFVLPTLSACGGVRMVIEAANRLYHSGWNVSLATNGECTSPSIWEARCFETPFIPVDCPIYEGLPQWIDLAIATGWDTAAKVAEHQKKGHGLAGWYIQNWEEDWYDTSVKTNPGISHLACCSEDLAARVASAWGTSLPIRIPSGIDVQQYTYSRGSTCTPRASRVLIPWRESLYKNPEGLRELARAIRRSGRDVVLLSVHAPFDLDFYKEFEGCWWINPTQENIARLYSISDFLVTASYSEGHAVTTLEAVAAGCTPIVQASGNMDSFPVGTGVIVPALEPEYYLTAMEKFESDRCNWGKKQKEARDYVAAHFSWEKVLVQWNIFLRAMAKDLYGCRITAM